MTEDTVEKSLAVEEEPTTDTEPQSSSDEISISPVEKSPTFQEHQWTLPVRAAPLLEQFHEEVVTEFPLQQTADGTKCTSLVVDDGLLRIIETRLDLDGQRRMNVSLSMKRELTGFKHQHNELMHKHQYLWLGLSFLGVGLLVSNILVFTLLGLAFVSAGILNWTKMHFCDWFTPFVMATDQRVSPAPCLIRFLIICLLSSRFKQRFVRSRILKASACIRGVLFA